MSKVRIDTSECEEIARNLNAIAGSLSGMADNVSSSIRRISGLLGLIGAITSWWKIKQISHKVKSASKCISESVDLYKTANNILDDVDWTAHNDFSRYPTGKPSNIKISTNMSDEDKRLRDEFIKQYELVNKDHADKMNNLFSEAPEEYADDVKNIKYIAYTSEGTCRELFFEYVSDMEIAEYDALYDGNPGNYFSSSDGKMHLNIDFIRKIDNKYGSFFHESGHDIDWIIAKEKEIDGRFTTTILQNGQFHSVIYSEVNSTVKQCIDDYSNYEKHLSYKQKQLIEDVLMGRKEDKDIKNTNIDFDYRKILEDITGYWKGSISRKYLVGGEIGIMETAEVEAARMVKEVFSGATNTSLLADEVSPIEKNKIEGERFAHSIRSGYVGGEYYYKQDRSSNGGVEKEFMAEFMRINMTDSKAENDYTKRYLGKSWETLENGIKEHLNGLH